MDAIRTKVDIDNWPRKAHFNFYKDFEEPFYGITSNVDCTKAYQKAKKIKTSFFLYYLHKSITAINRIENFRYRLEGSELFLYDQIHLSVTIHRPDNTFGFCYISFSEDFPLFEKAAQIAIQKVKQEKDLIPDSLHDNLIHYSAIPWIKFTSLSHVRQFKRRESIPKISFGQLSDVGGKKTMPVSIHVHHALVDAFHIGQHLDIFQSLLNE